MPEETTETAKAVQEVAKTTGQGIETVNKVGNFFARIMGESIDATCGMLADTLKYKRWERQIALVEKAERLIKEKNLLGVSDPVSPKLALPIFSYASIEDDDFLHDLYAKLLVTAIDPEVQTRRTAFAELIREMEPIDVKILQQIYEDYKKQEEWRETRFKESWSNEHKALRLKFRKVPPTFFSISMHDILKSIDVDEFIYWTSFDNLCRLGLTSSYVESGSVDFDISDESYSEDVVKSHGGYDSVCITALGVAFVEICNY